MQAGSPGAPVYSATFTFAAGTFDAAFHQLDAEIAAAAREIPGYLGEESWENAATGLVANVYYWATLEALEQLMRHPSHLAAKRRQAQWLDGYHVVIAQVLHSFGDGGIAHPLAVSTDSPGNGTT